jgi:hypothetical protein
MNIVWWPGLFLVFGWRWAWPSRVQNVFLPPTRSRRPRAIKIRHLALIRLDVVGVNEAPNEWGHVIVISLDPVVCVYFIRHVIRVTIEPILAVHEVHALGFGVPHTLHARPRRCAPGKDGFELILIDGDTRTDAVVSQSLSEFTIGF